MEFTSERIRDLLHYNQHSGVFTWRHRPTRTQHERMANGKFNSAFAGKEAGKIKRGEQAYIEISIGDKYFYAHRIAWIYMTGQQPPIHIDHIDGNPKNNKWLNLRDGTNLNRCNLAKYKNNKSGVTGVRLENGKWKALVTFNKEKHFLGRFKKLSDAKKAVEECREKLGCFTHDHGIREKQ